MHRHAAAALASTLLLFTAPLHAEGKACDLTTPEDLATVMGGKPTLKPSTLPNGVEVCTGKAAGSTVTIRLFDKRTSEDAEKERDAVDALKKQGATVEARKFSGVSCTAIGPGGKAARQPYVTSCSVANKQKHAVIEVSNPSLEIPMKNVAPVAEKIGSRFWQL